MIMIVKSRELIYFFCRMLLAFGGSQKFLWFELIDFYSISSFQSLISNSVEPSKLYCTAIVKAMMTF